MVTGKLEIFKNCGVKDTCLNQTIRYPSLKEIMKNNIFRRPCFCDDRCKEFGDCCKDQPSELGQNYKINGIPRDEWTCDGISDKEFVFSVTRCKKNTFLAKFCSKIDTKNYHYILDVPVYSRRTGIIYGNIFCSICHNDFKELERLNITIMCTNENITSDTIRTKGKYWPGLSVWTVGNETCVVRTSRDWTILSNSIRTRRCVPSIDDCPKTWLDLQMAAKCNAYQQLMMDKNGNIYKNPHCAVCNGVDISSIRCWHNLYYRKSFFLPKLLPNPSLSMVMNFNWDFRSCELPEVWDGLMSSCRDISCQRSYRECIKFNSSYENLIASQIEGYLTMTCLMISVICLLMHNIIYYSLPKQQNLPAHILKSLSWSLLLAQVVFLLGVTPVIEISHMVCQGVAVTVHFFFLASFFWMNTMSLDIWRTFSNSYLTSSAARSYLSYSIYAWGVPLILVAVSVICDLTTVIPEEYSPQYANFKGVCWFASRVGLIIFFYVPIWSLLLVNTILFINTLCYFQKQSYLTDLGSATGRKEYTRFWLYLKLWTIMGLSWSFGMIASLASIPNFWYPFIVLNGLQGAFIFIMFDLKQNILDLVFDKFKFNLSHVIKKEVRTQRSKLGSTSLSSKPTLTTH